MMHWEPTATTTVGRHRELALAERAHETASEDGGDSVLQYLLGAVLAAVSRLGSRSLALAAALAFLVALLLLGLSPEDASAGVQWCPRC